MPAPKKNAINDGAPGAPGQPGGAGAEVAEERVEVVTYAAAIDVAKGPGMVCTRVPGSRADRKRQSARTLTQETQKTRVALFPAHLTSCTPDRVA
jgi:hypothetical protein